jgi:hypothetical protein
MIPKQTNRSNHLSDDAVHYSIKYKNTHFIKSSNLGFEFRGAKALCENLEVIGFGQHQNTTWSQIWAKIKNS